MRTVFKTFWRQNIDDIAYEDLSLPAQVWLESPGTSLA